MLKRNETKQNPVAELSGFCYTSIKTSYQRYFGNHTSGKSTLHDTLATYKCLPTTYTYNQDKRKTFFHLQLRTWCYGLFYLLLRLPRSRFSLEDSQTHSSLLSFSYLFFNERSARSESIITNLTSDVKNSVLNFHFQRLNKAIKKGIMSQIESFLIGKNNFDIALLGQKRLAMMKFYEINQ